jgi:putative DNA primase/helicase
VPVFPGEPSGKWPLTKSGHWDATTDEGLLRWWWRRWPSANVAVPMGKGSGLLVLDVDPDRGGEAALAQLERSCGRAPRTARARTGGGSLHLYFRYPSEAKVEVRNSAG